MIVQIIGGLAVGLFCLQFCLAPTIFNETYEKYKGYIIIDNTLLLICAAICFK